jgi:hypothetical protein
MVRRLVLAGALLALTLPAASAASAAPAANHCVVHVTGQKASGELTTSSPRCYTTFSEAMRAERVTAWGEDASARAADSGVALASFTLGIHYDFTGQNPAGGSTSTVGSSCTGGWLNTSAAWNNRIGSTSNGCPSIRHYDGYNLTGTSVVTFPPGGDLGVMNNRTSSIQYL